MILVAEESPLLLGKLLDDYKAYEGRFKRIYVYDKLGIFSLWNPLSRARTDLEKISDFRRSFFVN